MAGGTERIQIIITDRGTVRALRKELQELAKEVHVGERPSQEAGEGVRRIAMRVKKGGDRIVRKAALTVSQTLVTATPVDKGTARSNWIARLDDPFAGVIESHGPGAAQVAVSVAAEEIAGYDGDENREIHITNNLRYITPLNNGHSAQAPAGFVEESVQAATQVVRTIKNGILTDGD